MSRTASMMYCVSWALVGACASILLAGCNIKHELGGQDTSFNKTTTAEEVMETIAPRWTLVAGVCVGLVGCCIGVLPIFLLFQFLVIGETKNSFSLWPNADVSDEAFRGEAYLVLFLPACGFSVAWATFRLLQDPAMRSCIQAFLLAGIVGRMMIADAKKSTQLRGTSLQDQEGAGQSQSEPPNVIVSVGNLIIEDVKGAPTPPPFLGSKVEGSDAMLDGIAIAVVMEAQKDPFWMARFELAFAGAPIIGPVAETCGLPVLMGGALALATVIQLSMATEIRPAADIAGLGVAARLLLDSTGANSESERDVGAIVVVGRVVYECCFQLLLQGSAVMAAGTPIIQQPALAASMTLSVLTGLLKVKDLIFNKQEGGIVFRVFGLAGASIFIFAVFRMAMAQSCPSFLWGISTGCVEVPDQLMPSMQK